MSLPKYIVNFEELTDNLKLGLLQAIEDELRDKYPKLNFNNIEALLEEIKNLLPSDLYEGLKKKIDTMIYTKIEGIQKVKGELLDVPPLQQDNKVDFQFDKDTFLTGIHFNQTGWKKEDRYTLSVNKNKVINNATLKEIGEHKYFNTYFKVNANTPISFILHNLSGNSRQTFVDLEYIEGTEKTEVIEPEVPSIDDIPNDWDIAVVMQWEANTNADIDLHGYLGDMHVYFGNKSYENFFLNFDYTEHTTNCNPEILSVKGYKNKNLDIYINNYKGTKLKEPINIKIFNKRLYSNKLLKEFTIELEATSSYLRGVCTINLKDYTITKLDKDIRTLSGGV